MIADLRQGSFGYGNSFFPGVWEVLGLYSLDMGRASEPTCLADYWDTLPTIPSVFGYATRSNGYGLARCFMARFHDSILVSQQTWTTLQPAIGDGSFQSNDDEWNSCTSSYNEHIAPLLSSRDHEGYAMVVYSSFRRHAYIVSSPRGFLGRLRPGACHTRPSPGRVGDCRRVGRLRR